MKQLILLLIISFPLLVYGQCEHPDYAGLMELYESTGGDNWERNDGWSEGKEGISCDPCDFNGGTWRFVDCTDGRVTSVYIYHNDLEGIVPNFELSELEAFSIVDDQITGIPEFSKTPKLKSLAFVRTALSGSLPEFSDVAPLEILDLTSASYTGEIDVTKLPDLKELILADNDLTGTIPDFSNFERLVRLDLRVNLLEGSVPNFQLPNLEYLDLFQNQLTGIIPSFEFLPSLSRLSFERNMMEGEVHNFEHNPLLNSIELSYNNFSGPLPDFGDHPKLTTMLFQARDNDFSGCYPESICDLDFAYLRNNDKLPFRGDVFDYCRAESLVNVPCSPSDSVPVGFFDFENCTCSINACDFYQEDYVALLEFYFATNGDSWTENHGWEEGAAGESCAPCDFHNSFEDTWYGVKCFEGKVVAIDLDGNPDFTQIGVGGNNVSGEMSSLDMEKLEALYLDENFISGSIPSLLKTTSLKTLIISRNEMTGGLSELENAKNLKIFRGSFNKFTGPIPDISTLDSLETFTCSNNFLEGCLDSALCNLPLVDFRFNEALPWTGDLVPFCNGESQIGAPCNLMADEEYVINDDCECVLKMNTNIKDVKAQSFSCYPNPASNLLVISGALETHSFTIYDSRSNKILESSENRIDISELESGLYFIKISSSEALLKFVKVN